MSVCVCVCGNSFTVIYVYIHKLCMGHVRNLGNNQALSDLLAGSVAAGFLEVCWTTLLM